MYNKFFMPEHDFTQSAEMTTGMNKDKLLKLQPTPTRFSAKDAKEISKYLRLTI